jgi:hypothetical protein
MQRLYIYIIIAAVIFAASYSKNIKNFFMPEQQPVETARPAPSSKQDDSYEQLGSDLYRIAATYSNLQGKAELLKMAKEKKEWYRQEDYATIDAMLESTQKEMAKAEQEYLKAKDEYTRVMVQKMLQEYGSGKQQ